MLISEGLGGYAVSSPSPGSVISSPGSGEEVEAREGLNLVLAVARTNLVRRAGGVVSARKARVLRSSSQTLARPAAAGWSPRMTVDVTDAAPEAAGSAPAG